MKGDCPMDKKSIVKQTITEEEVKQLLKKPESATLDFKRKAYSVDNPKKQIKEQQRDELIKDILAFSNSNAVSAGETSYIIIGADDKFSEIGERKLFDVKKHRLTNQRVLNWINSACEPSIQDVFCEDIDIDGITLLVITIPPSPYIHETIRRLVPQNGTFNEYTVFVRHNEDIRIASSKERETLQQVKYFRFNERKNPPAMLFGSLVGSAIGGALGYALKNEKDKFEEIDSKTLGMAGMTAGGIMGLSIGSVYKSYYEIRSEWHNVPAPYRIPFLGITVFFTVVFSRALSWLFDKRKA